ncbi:HAD family hydrolase [Actinoallomurus rhizosphaericola]|uniref:HAD family hydrolase n=1 Tax=Actinoallomurus rhizosphaericola TaxID=2952536 RepID=UPI002090B59E|nr:HAD family hydrolase [Actinoallomurus rhizosphaericola]MCO5994242.1 HAD family hydrolase [Actinoallomurus rhizosphaericola]
MGSIRAVFFDLDATLIDYDRAAWHATVRRVCAALTADAAELNGDRLFDAYTGAYAGHLGGTEGTIARSPSGSPEARAIWGELWRRALSACGCESESIAERALDLYVRDRKGGYRLFDDVLEVLGALRGRVDALAVVTNGPADAQRDKLTATGLDRHFDEIVVSAEVGVAKPDRAIFDLALCRLGVGPESVWHVGDSLATDVLGARNARLGAGVWLNRAGAARRPGDPAPRHEITSLRALPGLIDQPVPE